MSSAHFRLGEDSMTFSISVRLSRRGGLVSIFPPSPRKKLILYCIIQTQTGKDEQQMEYRRKFF